MWTLVSKEVTQVDKAKCQGYFLFIFVYIYSISKENVEKIHQ